MKFSGASKQLKQKILKSAHRVLQAWKLEASDTPKQLVSRLATYLTADFDSSDAAVSVHGFTKPIVNIKNDKEAEIDFLDDTSYPYRVWLRQIAGEWLVAAIKFQCPVCFGDGKNDGRSCQACSGVGWGVASE